MWNSKVLLDDEMFILLKFESYYSPIGFESCRCAKTQRHGLKHLKSFQPTSPWKKCTGVAGSSAGSLLPTKELSTNTAPQDGSSSTQSRDDVKDSNSQRQKTRWWLGKWSTLFSASMLDLKAVKPWISWSPSSRILLTFWRHPKATCPTAFTHNWSVHRHRPPVKFQYPKLPLKPRHPLGRSQPTPHDRN